MMSLEKEAMEFAKKAHEGQTRWDGHTPYFTHLESVVKLLKSFKITAGNEKLIVTGWLHDTVEDTDISLKEIIDKFGLEVANLVEELTHDAKTDKEYIQMIGNMSDDAKLIKLADLLSNITDTGSKKSNHFISKRLTAISVITATLAESGVLKLDS